MAEQDNTNHISSVRAMLLGQMAALKAAVPGEALEAELQRSKGMSDLSQTVIHGAKVEVEYLKATGQHSAPFLDGTPGQLQPPTASGLEVRRLPGDGNGITSITQHRLKG